MIIVGQEKTKIINFDNINKIHINGINEIICTDIEGSLLTVLGVYKTEERAKEVLQEIIEGYKHSYEVIYNNLSTPTLVPRPIVYKMPKE